MKQFIRIPEGTLIAIDQIVCVSTWSVDEDIEGEFPDTKKVEKRLIGTTRKDIDFETDATFDEIIQAIEMACRECDNPPISPVVTDVIHSKEGPDEA